MMVIFFFFSSRRRHTRLQGDRSSDVCSSDLKGRGQGEGCVCDSRQDPSPQSSPLRGERRAYFFAMTKNRVRILLVGSAGRMGKVIVDLAKEEPNVEIAAQCDLGDDVAAAMKECDVAIDFSQPGAVEGICRAALQD